MILCGIGNEAGSQIEQQLAATQALGWQWIELFQAGGGFVCNMSPDEWKTIWEKVQQAGVNVIGLCSTIGTPQMRFGTDFELNKKQLLNCAPYMREADARFLRVMSFPNHKETPLADSEYLKQVVDRLKELARMAEGEGIILAHENCSGYGGKSAANNVELFERVDSPAFQLIFDTENPSKLNDGLGAWGWYQIMKEHIAHVHVKDYTWLEDGTRVACLPGTGQGRLVDIFEDMFRAGYDGAFSIEPHIRLENYPGALEKEEDEARYEIFMDCGQRVIQLIDEAKQRLV